MGEAQITPPLTKIVYYAMSKIRSLPQVLAPGAKVRLWNNNATEACKQTVRGATKDCGRIVYI